MESELARKNIQDLTQVWGHSVRQSSDIIHHGRIICQGSRCLRWIMNEALHSHMSNEQGISIASFYRHLAKKSYRE